MKECFGYWIYIDRKMALEIQSGRQIDKNRKMIRQKERETERIRKLLNLGVTEFTDYAGENVIRKEENFISVRGIFS